MKKFIFLSLLLLTLLSLFACATTDFQRSSDGSIVVHTSSFYKDINNAQFTGADMSASVGLSASTPIEQLVQLLPLLQQLRQPSPPQ